MNNFLANSNNPLLDFETAAEGAITLSESQIEQAAALSSQILNPDQWQTYLQALAWFGFEAWLQSRNPELVLNSAQCSLMHPPLASFIPSVFNLEVSQFKLCLITPGVMLDEVISLPRAVVDLPEYAAHFYVVVAVDEEREEAKVTNFITYDELKQRQQSANLLPDSEWNYELPMACFDGEPDQLLLYLRCLEPSALPLPVSSQELPNLERLQKELASLIPQLQLPDTALSDLLSWEQASYLFTNPALLDWLYHLKTTAAAGNQDSVALRERLAATFMRLSQRAINVGAWLQNELDEMAQNLAWRLLPTPALATAFRDLTVTNRETPAAELAALVNQLRETGVEIPAAASSAYRDFTVGEAALRLYASAWETLEESEWSLLVILGAQPEQQLPLGLTLRIQEQETVLEEKMVERVTADSYLYTLVIGDLEEQFTVTLILSTGETFSLSPFVLQ